MNQDVGKWAAELSSDNYRKLFVQPGMPVFLEGVWPGVTIKQVVACTFPDYDLQRLPYDLSDDHLPGSLCQWLTVPCGDTPQFVRISLSVTRKAFCIIPTQNVEDLNTTRNVMSRRKSELRIHSLGVKPELIGRLNKIASGSLGFQACRVALALLQNNNGNHLQCSKYLQEIKGLDEAALRRTLQEYSNLTDMKDGHLLPIVEGAAFLVQEWRNNPPLHPPVPNGDTINSAEAQLLAAIRSASPKGHRRRKH